MLFMVMHKTDANMEAGGKPDQSIISSMGKLVGDLIKDGKLHNAAGLKRSAERVRLKFKDGKREVTQGPLRGENELVAGFAMLKVKSMEEAVSWASRFAEVVGDVEIDVGPVVEAWDLGLAPKPDNAPLRVLAVHKADKQSESGAPPSAEVGAKMGKLIAEMQSAGVFLAAEGLAPSSRGARLIAKGGKHTWTDGPFAESKELIAGFTILKADSIEEVKAWTTRYAKILGDVEVDVREVLS
jgi:hypothetical protein